MKNILISFCLIAQISTLNTDDSVKVYAQQGKEFAEEMLSKSKIDLEKTFTDVKDLEMLLNETGEGKGCKDCGSIIMNNSTQENSWVQGSSLVVFVSFSMPDIAIKELCREADKFGATLVLRGLHEDSFMATKDKILEINPDGLNLSIHPDLFKQYDIKRVPTFVLMKNGKEINRLSGNVTLEFAHRKLTEAQ